MARREDGRGSHGGRRDRARDEARRPGGDDPARAEDAAGGSPEEVEVVAVDLVTSLARLDLEAVLAYDAAVERCADVELREHLLRFAREHRAHLEALNEALEAEGEPAVGPQLPAARAVLAGLVHLTAPLGDEVIVVTLLGNEQLTNLGCDAALSYHWDDDTSAMLRRFQEDEERHLAWLVAKRDALGGRAAQPDVP